MEKKKESELKKIETLNKGDYIRAITESGESVLVSFDSVFSSLKKITNPILVVRGISRSKIYSGEKHGWVELFRAKTPHSNASSVVFETYRSAYNGVENYNEIDVYISMKGDNVSTKSRVKTGKQILGYAIHNAGSTTDSYVVFYMYAIIGHSTVVSLKHISGYTSIDTNNTNESVYDQPDNLIMIDE